MKRYYVATWQLNTPQPFIYDGKAYCIERLTQGIYSGQVRHSHCNFYFVLTDGTHVVKFDWREVNSANDISDNPEGIKITWSVDEKINEVGRWLDEQILEDKNLMEIDDMKVSGELPNVLEKGENK